MKNQTLNRAFLTVIDTKTKNEVLDSIANHYGIAKGEAMEEVTHEESEHLLDYLTGPIRMAISVLMRRHGIA